MRSEIIQTQTPTTPSALERCRNSIDAVLQESLAPYSSELYDSLRYHLGWRDTNGQLTGSHSGKALRPTLWLLACEWAGGKWEDSLAPGAALELVHNFSLIHDDIQDGDTERRHRPTLWSVWGRPKAIVAGNAMRCLADLTLLSLQKNTDVPAEIIMRLSQSLSESCLEMIEGQYMDLSFEADLDVSVDQYLDMVSRKTGALIECAMFMGALIATHSLQVASAFGRCGRLLGLAFQIRDDLLGIWGDSFSTGKATGADIARRKKSLPAIHALGNAYGTDRVELRRIYSQSVLSELEIQQVLQIMDRLHTYDFCQTLAEAKKQEAVAALQGLDLTQKSFREFQQVAKFLVSREH